ncbi:MAG: hypothetical protein IKU55_04570 [Clostridia bacterium]|nr:hypothetical protein [Clostridia bacterium]
MKWLQKFMFGRYGTDQLSLCLLAISVLLTVISMFCGVTASLILQMLSYVPIILVFLRMFSRNIARRRRENQWFLSLWKKLVGPWKRKRAQRKDKTHHYFRCKKCGATLRIPKGVGKVVITCPRCGAKAEGKA